VIEGALPAARAVHFAATLLIEGCLVFQFLVAAPALGAGTKDAADFPRFVYRTVIAAWIVAVLTGAAWLFLLSAELTDTSVAEAVSDGTTWTLLTQTQFGWEWIARAAGFLLLAILLGTQPETPLIPAQAGPVALSLALTGSLAWSGHGAASAGAEGDLHLAADILHLIASGIWLGGLLPFVIKLRLHPDSAAAISRHFSSVATASVLVLVATGIINAWVILPGLDALTGTLYGRLLLAKLGLFLLMLAFAGVNRFVLTPRLAIANLSGLARSRLSVQSRCEIALGLAILALVGVLGTLSPMPQEQQHHTAGIRGVATNAAFASVYSVRSRTGDARAHIINMFSPASS
jgi:putative copper resistance protein D